MSERPRIKVAFEIQQKSCNFFVIAVTQFLLFFSMADKIKIHRKENEYRNTCT